MKNDHNSDKIKTALNNAAKSASYTVKAVGRQAEKGAKAAAKGAEKAVKKGTELSAEAKQKIVEALDYNKDGQIDIEDIINLGMRAPTVRVDREKFLKKELSKYCTENVIENAVRTNPKNAGIDIELIDKICDNVIKVERYNVSGVSAVLGVPGGAAMLATIPVDIVQYYGVQLRAAQKMMYLYGFPELYNDNGNGEIDAETINILTLCLGVMFGVKAANDGVNIVAKMLAKGVPKQLMKKALTKGAVYPIVKQIAKWFGVRMTKEIFTGAIGKSIPVVGAVVGGGITFASFGPSCKMLKKSLRNTALSNPDIKLNDGEDVRTYANEVSDENIIELTEDDFEIVAEDESEDLSQRD